MSKKYTEKKKSLKTKKNRKAQAKRNKIEADEKAKNAPIGGKCLECGLRIRTNDIEKHNRGISHINRSANLKNKKWDIT